MLKGRALVNLKVLPRNLLGETEENHAYNSGV
jgi:hypothetical protein